MGRVVMILTAALAIGAPAYSADSVRLTIHDGQVSLEAHDATVREILSEWARIGQTRIVNGDRVPGGRVTLQLTNVPEQTALDLLLRTAAGYIAAPRAAVIADASRFDRILILPTSSVPVAAVRAPTPAPSTVRPAAAATAPPVFPQPQVPATGVVFPQAPVPATGAVPAGVQRVLGPDGQPLADDQQEGSPPPQRFVPLPPGFDGAQGDLPAQPPVRTLTPAQPPGAAPATPAGSAVPGMPVPAPKQPAPQPTQR
jgi:hypothetical protein